MNYVYLRLMDEDPCSN